MQTKITKGFDGWNAKTILNMPELDRVNQDTNQLEHARLTIMTQKASHGPQLITTARISFVRDNIETFAVFGDFFKTLAKNPCNRVTEASITKIHQIYTSPIEIEKTIVMALAYYAVNTPKGWGVIAA